MQQNNTSTARHWLARFLPFTHRESKSVRDSFPRYYYSQTYMHATGKPVWTKREYVPFADEAYRRNVVAFQAINKIATAASCVPWTLRDKHNSDELSSHPLLAMMRHPAPNMTGAQFIHDLISYRLISGNVYVLKVAPRNELPKELYLLRPDRVQVIAGKNMIPAGYRYSVGEHHTDYRLNPVTGKSDVLHLKTFHPLDDWYGLSPIEAAAYSIDQHNQAGEWNQALLQNGARPSGALVVKSGDANNPSSLSEDQYRRIKEQVDQQFSGAANAGRPLLLEGGLDWREMSISPRDMDFLNTKHSAARDISLAFGVPPQLLGIPGDNTYSNLAEARLALWEQTVIPLLDDISHAFNSWLVPHYGDALQLKYNLDAVSALSPRREQLWQRVKDCDFLTPEEKREMLGLGASRVIPEVSDIRNKGL